MQHWVLGIPSSSGVNSGTKRSEGEREHILWLIEMQPISQGLIILLILIICAKIKLEFSLKTQSKIKTYRPRLIFTLETSNFKRHLKISVLPLLENKF